jgi:DNA-binding SARP family transcriptional activator
MKESVLYEKRILAVDDEADVLEVLEEDILDACPTCQFDKATTYEAASNLLESQTYDLVILDIMGVRGFDLLTLAVQRNFKVVMLTAHAFNLEALKRSFELKARAYLPKEKMGEVVPFLEEVLKFDYMPMWKRLVRRNDLFPETWSLDSENWPWQLAIFTLGQFEIIKDREPVKFTGKVQRRPLLLLKALITLGGKEVGEEQLLDLLWPDSEGDAAHSSFTTTLSRLRQLLGIQKAIRVHGKTATLERRNCWVDAWAFERIYELSENMWKGSRLRSSSSEIIEFTEKAIDFYRGHFLPMDDELPWTVSYRERLKTKFRRLVMKLGDYLEEAGQWERAVEYYERALDVDDLAEELYQHLMTCHIKLGQWTEAIRVYHRCKKALSSSMGIEPSPKTQAIYRNLTGTVRGRGKEPA